jgi:hypothetical protein
MNSLPVQHVAPTPKKNNKIWIIVVVLLILCCLCSLVGVVIGYFYFQNNAAGIGEIFEPLVQPSQPNEAKSGEEIRSEEGGYAFKTIPGYEASPGWVVTGGYTLDSKDIDYGDPNFVIGEGPQIILSGFVPSSDLSFEKYVENGKSDWRIRSQATISGEPQVTVAGLKGVAFDYDYELAGAGKMKARDISVEVNPKQFFMIVCRSTVEKWDKTLADCDAVINSVTFFEPVPSPTQIP